MVGYQKDTRLASWRMPYSSQLVPLRMQIDDTQIFTLVARILLTREVRNYWNVTSCDRQADALSMPESAHALASKRLPFVADQRLSVSESVFQG